MKRKNPTPMPPCGPSGRYEQLKRSLQEHRRNIDISVREGLADVRERGAGPSPLLGEDGELGDVHAREDIELELIQLKQETIERIDDALARLESGSYGVCIDCGDEISEPRLRALPFAVRCLECQELREFRVREARAAHQRRNVAFLGQWR